MLVVLVVLFEKNAVVNKIMIMYMLTECQNRHHRS